MRGLDRRLVRLEAHLLPPPPPPPPTPELIAAVNRLFLPPDGRVNRDALFAECVQFLAKGAESQVTVWRKRFDGFDAFQIEHMARAMLSRFAPVKPPHPVLPPITDDMMRDGLRRLLTPR